MRRYHRTEKKGQEEILKPSGKELRTERWQLNRTKGKKGLANRNVLCVTVRVVPILVFHLVKNGSLLCTVCMSQQFFVVHFSLLDALLSVFVHGRKYPKNLIP